MNTTNHCKADIDNSFWKPGDEWPEPSTHTDSKSCVDLSNGLLFRFHMSCSVALTMKTFSLCFKSEGQGIPQMELSLVIFLTSPRNAGALGQQ
jgi:hypothetical protein